MAIRPGSIPALSWLTSGERLSAADQPGRFSDGSEALCSPLVFLFNLHKKAFWEEI
jgi:hypothetical protein